jgi:hypothetical protein
MAVLATTHRRALAGWSLIALLAFLCALPPHAEAANRVGVCPASSTATKAKRSTHKRKLKRGQRSWGRSASRGRSAPTGMGRPTPPPVQPTDRGSSMEPPTPAPTSSPDATPATTTDPGPTQNPGPITDGDHNSPPPCIPPPPRTEFPLWIGGFETNDFTQWKQLDGNLTNKERYFKLIGDPEDPSNTVFRSTVDDQAIGQAEAGGNASGQRAMVLLFPNNTANQNATGAYEGGERWYRTRMYFPADFHPSPNSAWNWLVQWHNWPNGPCCSNLALSVDARRGQEKLSLRVMGGGDQEHPVEANDIITEKNPTGHLEWFVGDSELRRQHWYDSVVHVKWSVDASKGYVEWWLDGKLIVSRPMATLYWYADNNKNFAGATPGPGQAYYMEGYYRPAKLPDGAKNGTIDTSTASVLFDGARMGNSAAAVAP